MPSIKYSQRTQTFSSLLEAGGKRKENLLYVIILQEGVFIFAFSVQQCYFCPVAYYKRASKIWPSEVS